MNKNNKYATIKGLKVGSAYIKAKIGKKTYRSKMTIKKKVVKTPSAPTVKNYTYNRIILPITEGGDSGVIDGQRNAAEIVLPCGIEEDRKSVV